MENALLTIQNELDLLSDKLTALARSNEYLEKFHLNLGKLEAERGGLFLILKKEEADVNNRYAMSVNMLYRHFLHIFYNNMIADWIVQSKSRNRENSMSATQAKVSRLLASLKRAKAQIGQAIDDIYQQWRNYITTSK